MDIKIQGLTRDLMVRALRQAREGRLYILEKMNECIAAPHKDLAKHAPRIYTLQIKLDRIRDIIGPGGRMVRRHKKPSISSRASRPSPKSGASTWVPCGASWTSVHS
jgi:polyribonucleotide nucleotidyltransferase